MTGPESGAAVDDRGPARLYARLLQAYGAQGWWPAREPFEMMVGAVLVQNTAWRNVEPAILVLREAGLLAPEAMATAGEARIAGCIRTSGTYRVKARRLLALAAFVVEAGGLAVLGRTATPSLRDALLAVHGIGAETADAILCYAFARPRFVIDAYTRRLCERLGVAADDDALRARFERDLPADAGVLGECHALIVAHAKAHCRARPRCAGCPLQARCSLHLSQPETLGGPAAGARPEASADPA